MWLVTWWGDSSTLSGGFLFCSVDLWVVAVLRPCFGFLSFGCHFGALSEWSLVSGICGMGVFFGMDPRGGEVGFFPREPATFGFWEWNIGGRWLRECGIYVLDWLAVELWLEEDFDLRTYYPWCSSEFIHSKVRTLHIVVLSLGHDFVAGWSGVNFFAFS